MEGEGSDLFRIIWQKLPATKQCPPPGPLRDNGCLSDPEQLTQFWDDDDDADDADDDDDAGADAGDKDDYHELSQAFPFTHLQS